MKDWKVFTGNGEQHDHVRNLPPAPPWRFAREQTTIEPRPGPDEAEQRRAAAFRPTHDMIVAVNAALYLRRPLLLTGKPGSGKSTLISKVAHELKLGPVLRWPITSRATVRSGVYEYDAVGRLHAGRDVEPAVDDFLTLGPLGTALLASGRPRPLLVDEIDKSDLDFANDLLNVIDEGEYEIPELRRLPRDTAQVRDWLGQTVDIHRGRIVADQFPFVVMTSNGEREFPGPFLRRCIRLNVEPPDRDKLSQIVDAQLALYKETMNPKDVEILIDRFLEERSEADVSTDQLLNTLFLTVAMRDSGPRTFSAEEADMLRATLLKHLSGGGA